MPTGPFGWPGQVGRLRVGGSRRGGDGLCSLRLGRGDRAAGAHRPRLPPVPLPDLRRRATAAVLSCSSQPPNLNSRDKEAERQGDNERGMRQRHLAQVSWRKDVDNGAARAGSNDTVDGPDIAQDDHRIMSHRGHCGFGWLRGAHRHRIQTFAAYRHTFGSGCRMGRQDALRHRWPSLIRPDMLRVKEVPGAACAHAAAARHWFGKEWQDHPRAADYPSAGQQPAAPAAVRGAPVRRHPARRGVRCRARSPGPPRPPAQLPVRARAVAGVAPRPLCLPVQPQALQVEHPCRRWREPSRRRRGATPGAPPPPCAALGANGRAAARGLPHGPPG